VDYFVASDDQALALRIRAGLHQLGIVCPASQVLSPDSAVAVIASARPTNRSVIFYGSQRFDGEQISLLGQLHAAGGDHLRIVAIATDFSPDTILHAVRGGAIDCLDINREFEQELRHLLDRVKADTSEKRAGRLIAVIGSVGGAGASMLATNLAVSLAQKDHGCCLLDLQLRGGDLAMMLQCRPKHNLLSLANKGDQLDRTMFEQSLIRHDCGIQLLAGPEPLSDFRRISVELIHKVVQFARANCGNVVVDMEDCVHPEQMRTLVEADYLIVLLRCDYISLYHTKKCLEHLASARVPANKILLVANRQGQGKEVPVKNIEETLGRSVKYCIPNDPDVVTASINLGVPVILSAPKSDVATSILRLTDAILGRKPPENGALVRRFFPLRAVRAALMAILAT
jgi:pilus assembly protein CpaE